MIENIIFSQLLTSDEYARAVLPHLKEDYFSAQQEKNFLKIYKRFFSKHNKIPSKQAMLIEVEKLKSSAEVYKSMVEIVERTIEFTESKEYLVEKTEEFCKEKSLFNALRESVLIMDGQSKDKGPDSIPSIIQEALSICFNSTVGHDYMADAMDRYEYYHHSEARIRTGIPILDKITKGGFPRKTFNVFLAPPHGGKTLAMINVAAGAVKHGANVLYITMEMAAEEIGRRFDVNLLDVDFDTLEVLPKATFESKFSKIAKESRGRLIIKEYPTGAASASHFRALLSELKQKQNFVPDMIVIDYMNICSSEYYKAGSTHNSYTIVGSVGKELRALAIEANAVVVTATQTNRSGVNNSDVDMTAVSDSAGTTMIADFMLAIITTDELKELKQILFRQLKNRYGGTSDFEKFILGIDYAKQILYKLDSGDSVPVANPTADKNKGLNKKAGNVVDAPSLDILHQIKSKQSFDDFDFND